MKCKLEVGIHRRERQQGEFATAISAIRSHCLECVGYDRAEVERCTDPGCWLYPFRFGTNPSKAAGQGKVVDHVPQVRL